MINPVELFKCLADDTRLRCLALLHSEGRLCVCELTQALDMLQPKISRHLALLRQHRVLLDSREGQWVYYQLNPDLPVWAAEILAQAAAALVTEPRAQADKQRLCGMEGRPGENRCRP